MKLKIIFVFLILAINTAQATSVNKIEPLSEGDLEAPVLVNKKTKIASPAEERPKFKNRHALTVDYGTWFETLRIKNTSTNTYSEAVGHYFGVGISYDFTIYREKYGYAFTGGYLSGSAQTGSEGGTAYYERRVPWSGFRGGARLFYRANNRIDLALGFLAQSKSTNWPIETSYSVDSQANPQYFYFVDTRWRLNYRTELIQAFGTHARSQALVWRFGINYTLN